MDFAVLKKSWQTISQNFFYEVKVSSQGKPPVEGTENSQDHRAVVRVVDGAGLQSLVENNCLAHYFCPRPMGHRYRRIRTLRLSFGHFGYAAADMQSPEAVEIAEGYFDGFLQVGAFHRIDLHFQ